MLCCRKGGLRAAGVSWFGLVWFGLLCSLCCVLLMNSDVVIALLCLQCAAVLRPMQPVAAILQHNQQGMVTVCVFCIAVQLVDVQLQLLG